MAIILNNLSSKYSVDLWKELSWWIETTKNGLMVCIELIMFYNGWYVLKVCSLYNNVKIKEIGFQINSDIPVTVHLNEKKNGWLMLKWMDKER